MNGADRLVSARYVRRGPVYLFSLLAFYEDTLEFGARAD